MEWDPNNNKAYRNSRYRKCGIGERGSRTPLAMIIVKVPSRVLQWSRKNLYICRMGSQSENPILLQQRFFKRVASTDSFLELFEFLPGVCMYAKDQESRFIKANRVFQELVGASSSESMIGHTDFDYFPPAIASQYVAEDKRVLHHGALLDQVWMVPAKTGVPRLYFCSKKPLLDKKGAAIGVAAVKRPFEYGGETTARYGRLIKVMSYVSDHYRQSITVTDMADVVSLSASQLQREFSRNFGIAPVRYLREVRIGVARHLLESSDMDMVEVAAECGFYDQSHFSRQFKSSTGLTPLKYRSRFRDR